MKDFVLLALALSFFLSCGVTYGEYVKVSNCKNVSESCLYQYHAGMELGKGEQVSIFAKVEISCESVGTFNNELSIRSCMQVRDCVITKTSEDSNNDPAPVEKLDKWFCFAQSTLSGKVLGVFYGKEEEEWVVNFKKSITSAFQANYEGTTVTNETDSQSKHMSHYKFFEEGNNRQIQERRVDTKDVEAFAGNSGGSSENLEFHEHDKLELDSKKRIQFSEGKTVIDIGKGDGNMALGDDEKEIPPLGASTSYKLKLVRCSIQSTDDDVVSLSSVLYSQEITTGDLLATRDEVKESEEEMMELYEELPSFDETLSNVQEETDSKKSMQLIADWRRLLQLESKNGALPGTKAKRPQLLQRLEEIKTDDTASDERELIYHLLSSEGSLESQKALVNMLRTPLDSSEVTNLLVDIALFPTVHTSTVDSLLNYHETLENDNYFSNQLLLSIATLGRHENVQDKIVSFLSVKLLSAKDSEETSLLLHALGNTASKKIIPLILPFLSDPNYQANSIDALRTVSMDDRVEEEFANIVSDASYPQVVLEVAESLLFPFKHSIYSPQIEIDTIVNEDLKTSLVEAGIKYNDNELTKILHKYFIAIKDKVSDEKLREGLETKTTTVDDDREKRASTSDWDSKSNSNYNLVRSRSGRSRDVSKYPYHRGYLWATEIGYSKIHADIAAGGFGGVGIPGIKLYARARIDLVAWKKTYTALDIIFSYVRKFPDRNSVSTLTYRRYIKIVGSTLLNTKRTTTKTYRYTRSWQRTVTLFKAKYSFFIYVGTLDFTLSGYISGQMKFNAYIARLNNGANMKASAMLETGPTLTIKGDASAKILIKFRIGMTVSASISYIINPEASTSVCGSSSQDANACFEVYGTTKGNISVYAYWRVRKIRCKKIFKCKISWGGKKKFSKLSRTWSLVNKRRKLFGLCYTCNCYGRHPLNVLCKGSRYGASRCSCSTRRSG